MHLEQVNHFMILAEKGLSVSFSKVKYRDMAPRVGLNSFGAGNDMQTFDIHRARIPTSLFKGIVQDLEVSMRQYGEPNEQVNEGARSRYLAPVSAQWQLPLLPIFGAHAPTSFLVALSDFLI
jgi:hypothetical protein